MNTRAPAAALPITRREASPERLAGLFDTHYNRLYTLARRLTRDADAARDLVQDTFLKAAASIASVPAGASSEEAWLVRVLINTCRDDWRKASVRRRYAQNSAGNQQPATSDQEAALVARAAVHRALDALTPRRRAIVVMHEIEGLSVAAVSALLGISRVTVRWHLSRGRRDLARRLGARVGDGK